MYLPYTQASHNKHIARTPQDVVEGTEGQWGGGGWGRGYKRDDSPSTPSQAEDAQSSPAVVEGTEAKWGGGGWGRGYVKRSEDDTEASPAVVDGTEAKWGGGGWGRGYAKRSEKAEGTEKAFVPIRGYAKREEIKGAEKAFGPNRGYVKRDDGDESDGRMFRPNRGYKREHAEGTEGTEQAFGPNRGYKRSFTVRPSPKLVSLYDITILTVSLHDYRHNWHPGC